MTPTTLAAAMHRAGVGQHHDMTGSPYPYRNHDEEAEAIMAELPKDGPSADTPSVDVQRCDGCGASVLSLRHFEGCPFGVVSLPSIRPVSARLRVLFCRHQWAVHLCQPPSGVPSLVICSRCNLVSR